jgi:hypothetical protein
MSPRPSRRGFLGAAGGALLASGGCLRRLQDGATSVNHPPAGPTDYREWLPAPAAIPRGEDYHGMHIRVADLLGDGPVERAGTNMRNLFARVGRDPLDIPPQDVDVVVNADLTKATTLLGTFDPEAIHRAAERAGYDRTGEYRGFTTYERRDRPYAIAVSSEAVVHSWVPDGAHRVVERVVDAGRGTGDRYHGTHDRYRRLHRAVGGGTTSWIQPETGGRSPDGVVGSASATTFADGNAYFAQAYLFEDAAAASADAMRDALTANDAYPRSAPLDVTVDGRMGRAEFRRDPEDLFDPPAVLSPLVAWGFAEDGEAGELVVTHRAGDPVTAFRLELKTNYSSAATQFADRYDTVEPGDSVVVPVEPDSRVRVIWSAGDSSSTLATHDVDGGVGKGA